MPGGRPAQLWTHIQAANLLACGESDAGIVKRLCPISAMFAFRILRSLPINMVFPTRSRGLGGIEFLPLFDERGSISHRLFRLSDD